MSWPAGFIALTRSNGMKSDAGAIRASKRITVRDAADLTSEPVFRRHCLSLRSNPRWPKPRYNQNSQTYSHAHECCCAKPKCKLRRLFPSTLFAMTLALLNGHCAEWLPEGHAPVLSLGNKNPITAIAESFRICSHAGMERIDPTEIANALLTSAGWARVGLTASNEHLREQAAKELALAVCERISPSPPVDTNQLSLPI